MSSSVNLKIGSPFDQQKKLENVSKYFLFNYQIFPMVFPILYNFQTTIFEPVWVTELAISLLVAQFSCFILLAKFSDLKLLNSGVVTHLWCFWSVIFFSIPLIFVL